MIAGLQSLPADRREAIGLKMRPIRLIFPVTRAQRLGSVGGTQPPGRSVEVITRGAPSSWIPGSLRLRVPGKDRAGSVVGRKARHRTPSNHGQTCSVTLTPAPQFSSSEHPVEQVSLFVVSVADWRYRDGVRFDLRECSLRRSRIGGKQHLPACA